jgi:hypothetical protein
MLILATSFLFDFTRVAIFDLASTLTLKGCDFGILDTYDQFPLLISKLVDILIQ